MCCGRPPSPYTTPSSDTATAPNVRRVLALGIAFEYSGATGMTVRGAVTGVSYRFARPGARVLIDPRDVPSLVSVPRLRRV